MSGTTSVVCDNENCEKEFEKRQAYRGHCSEECYYKHRGRKFLKNLKFDHRICFSCLTKLKEVERPTDEQLRSIQGKHSSEAVVGYQYRTPEATTGEITAREDTNDVVVTGTVCGECGCSDHSDDYLRDFQPKKAAKNLQQRVRETREEGQHDKVFSLEAFVEAWNDVYDWSYAVGVAISPDSSG